MENCTVTNEVYLIVGIVILITFIAIYGKIWYKKGVNNTLKYLLRESLSPEIKLEIKKEVALHYAENYPKEIEHKNRVP